MFTSVFLTFERDLGNTLVVQLLLLICACACYLKIVVPCVLESVSRVTAALRVGMLGTTI